MAHCALLLEMICADVTIHEKGLRLPYFSLAAAAPVAAKILAYYTLPSSAPVVLFYNSST